MGVAVKGSRDPIFQWCLSVVRPSQFHGQPCGKSPAGVGEILLRKVWNLYHGLSSNCHQNLSSLNHKTVWGYRTHSLKLTARLWKSAGTQKPTDVTISGRVKFNFRLLYGWYGQFLKTSGVFTCFLQKKIKKQIHSSSQWPPMLTKVQWQWSNCPPEAQFTYRSQLHV